MKSSEHTLCREVYMGGNQSTKEKYKSSLEKNNIGQNL